MMDADRNDHEPVSYRIVFLALLCALGAVTLLLLVIHPAQATNPSAGRPNSSTSPSALTIITVNSAADPSEAGKCTLRDAIENANNNNGGHTDCRPGLGADRIEFDSSIGQILLTSALPNIQDDLTIYGGQNAGQNQVISGQDSSNIFWVAANVSLQLERMTLTHGSYFFGGAVSAQSGSTVVITDSVFSYNQAPFDGGAIDIVSGALTITHSSFLHNQADRNGGAVYVTDSSLVIRQNSSFTENSSQLGGAIYQEMEAEIQLTGSNFSENTASETGGALFQHDGELNVSDCQFADNTGQKGGGAIDMLNGNAAITGSGFSNNRVWTAGGGGGAIASRGSSRTSISDSVFFDNYAPGRGGAIFSTSALTVTSTSFQDNSVNTGSGSNGLGGAIQLLQDGTDPVAAWMESSTFFSNIAENGGAIDVGGGATMNLINSTLYTNTATSQGGAIHLHWSSVMTVTHSTIARNGGPQAIFLDNNNLTLRHSLVINNNGINCSAGVIDGDYNLQFGGSDPDSCGSNIEIGDPRLGPLADNGGPTMSMMYQNHLPINRIPGDNGCGVGVFNDQRGVFRPVGVRCDIGAVESNLKVFLPTLKR